ncbi:MAG: low molecular weight protein-tyrosine-phosphatase [Bacteroidota bacterium]
MTKVLMVCLGNICRSPLAQGILEAKTNPTEIYVDSAGTAGYHVGEPPDSRSIAVAKKHQIDISQQRSRKFLPSDFENFDHIYVMDKTNYADVLAQARTSSQAQKVKLLLKAAHMKTQAVPDPYYGGEAGFDHVFDLIDKACEVIATKL